MWNPADLYGIYMIYLRCTLICRILIVDVDEFKTEVGGDVNESVYRCINECSRRMCNLKYARQRCKKRCIVTNMI